MFTLSFTLLLYVIAKNHIGVCTFAIVAEPNDSSVQTYNIYFHLYIVVVDSVYKVCASKNMINVLYDVGILWDLIYRTWKTVELWVAKIFNVTTLWTTQLSDAIGSWSMGEVWCAFFTET